MLIKSRLLQKPDALKQPLTMDEVSVEMFRDGCQNHSLAEKSAFGLQPTKVQPRCHVQGEPRQPVHNSHLRSSPSMRRDTDTRLRVSRNSPTSPHLRQSTGRPGESYLNDPKDLLWREERQRQVQKGWSAEIAQTQIIV